MDISGLFGLATRNVLRHRARTAMTLAAIAFGVISLILAGGFVRDLIAMLGEAVIHSQSGHIQISKLGFQAKGTRNLERYVLKDPEVLKARVAAMPGVLDAMGRVNFSGLLNNGRTDLSIIGEGIEADKEARVGTYIVISQGRQLSEKDRFGALIGQGVAEALNLVPGDAVTLVTSTAEGATNTLDLEVVGVFQTFSKDYDARAVKIGLRAAQALLDTRGVNTLVISLAATGDTEKVIGFLHKQLDAEGLEVISWKQLNDFYDKTVKLYDRQFGVLQLIILAMVLLSVTNTVNMTIFERLSEFGTMQALGNRGGQVVRLIVAECAVLGAVGALLGAGFGIALGSAISAIGIPMPPPPNSNIAFTAKIALMPAAIVQALLVGFTATILAGVAPALRVRRVPIVDALRQTT